MSIRIYILTSFIFYCLILYSQQIPITQFNVSDGVAHSTVYKVCEDKKGNIWFGTNDGVTKFNGVDFENYRSNNSTNYITDICFNGKDELVAASFKEGIFNLKNGKLINQTVDNEYTAAKIKQFIILEENIIFAVTNVHRLVRVMGGNVVDFTSSLTEKFDSLEIFTIQKMTDSKLLIGTNYGLVCFDVRTEQSELIFELQSKIKCIKVEDSVNIWIGSEGAIYHLNNKRLVKYTNSVLKNNFIENIEIDYQGSLWLSLSKGGVVLMTADNNFLDITDELSLTGRNVTDIHIDQEGNIWFSTYGAGVFFVRFDNLLFKNYTIKDGLANGYVSCFAVDTTGKVYVGTFKSDHHFNVLNKGNLKLAEVTSSNSLDNLNITDIIVNNMGEVYVTGLYDMGETSKVIVLRNGIHINTIDLTQPISKFYKDRQGEIWCIFYTKGIGKIKDNKCFPVFSEHFGESQINDIYNDSQGKLWLTSDKGVFCIDKSNAVTLYTTKNGLSNNIITSICETSDSIIWVTTDKFLHSFNGSEWVRQNNLDIGKCKVIVADTSSNIFIGTDRGLFVYQNKDWYKHFDSKTGLPSDNVNDLMINDNHLYVATNGGFSIIEINKVFVSIRLRKPLLNKLSFPLKHISISESKDSIIQLDYESNSFNLSFSSLNFSHNSNIQYQYKYDNQKEWKILNSNSIEFSKLAYGNYNIQVRVKYKYGNIVSPTSLLSISIVPPFWETAWFRILFFTCILGLFLTGVYFYSKKVHLQQLKKVTNEKRMIELEINSLSALLKPHFTFNLLNTIQALIVEGKLDEAGVFITKLGQLIRISMENSQENFISLEKEIERIELYLFFEKIRFNKKFSIVITIDSNINSRSVKLPALILQPYVENAVWHGIMPCNYSGKLKINIRKESDRIAIEIEDNGVGINQSILNNKNRRHKSMGMKLNEERINLLSKMLQSEILLKVIDKKNQSSTETGTIIRIELGIYY